MTEEAKPQPGPRKPPVIHEDVTNAVACGCVRFETVLFRGRLHIGCGHSCAIDLAFKNMTELAQRNVSNRITDGKETMLFGYARADGTEWEWEEKYQNSRLRMYGFI